MKHTKLVILFLLLALQGLRAQWELNVTGNKATGASGTLEYSVGYLAGVEAKGNNGYMIAGVLQPKEINNPLPIKLLSFYAQKKEGRQVLLRWATAGNKLTRLFWVEKSKDGVNFTAFAQVAGGYSYSNGVANYAATDSNAYQPTSYYRLHMIELDGHSNYSAVEAVNFDGNETTITAFPNPASESVYIYCPRTSLSLIARIVDLTGKVVAEYPLTQSTSRLSLLGLKANAYLITIFDKGTPKQSFKIIKN